MRRNEMVNGQGQPGTTYIELNRMNTAVDLINDLISSNRGLINVYETAADRLEATSNARLLRGYAEQHERFVTELSNLVVRFGGAPATSGTGSSLAKQVWVSLKSAITEGDGPVLAEVAQDAEQILVAYGEAMTKDIPDEARQLIRTHLTDVRLAHKKLSAMSTAYNS